MSTLPIITFSSEAAEADEDPLVCVLQRLMDLTFEVVTSSGWYIGDLVSVSHVELVIEDLDGVTIRIPLHDIKELIYQ